MDEEGMFDPSTSDPDNLNCDSVTEKRTTTSKSEVRAKLPWRWLMRRGVVNQPSKSEEMQEALPADGFGRLQYR